MRGDEKGAREADGGNSAQGARVIPFRGQRASSAPREPRPEPPRGNLPASLTSFVGRRQEIAAVTSLLAATRLLTLTGAGGVGKTRLALEVAANMAGRYTGGVWLVELAALADPNLVPQAVASGLSLRESGGRPILDTLIDTLRERRPLLLLDNCEHLSDACASLCEALLRGCPDLQVLATSRQPTGLPGETVWRVPSLSLPATTRPVGSVVDSEAGALFVERAAATLSTFAVTGKNAPFIVGISHQLDGIPLAIELAAAWVRVLSVEEIASRLGDRFRLLTRGNPTALPRQQTLRGTLDWSYELLTDPERVLLRRLAVFEGGWTLDAAEDVCAGNPYDQSDVLGILALLVDKSLVLAEAEEAPARYRLLETTRQYGWEHLASSGEAETLRRRHTAYFLTLAQQAQPELLGPAQIEWMGRLDRERDNLRAALRWAIDTEDRETEIRLVAALWDFWWMRGYLSEGQGALDGALARTGSTSRARAQALDGAGILASVRGDLATGATRFTESVALFRAIGDRAHFARPLADLGTALWIQGDPQRAQATLDESLSLAREVGDGWGIAYALEAAAQHRCSQGQYEAAGVFLEEAVQAWRALGDKRGLAHSLVLLADVVRGQGDPDRATAMGRECLDLFRQLGETWGALGALVSLAASAAMLMRAERAARLLGAADALSAATGAALVIPYWRAGFDSALAAARAGMEESAFETVWAEGRAMLLDDAIVFALAPEELASPPAPKSTDELAWEPLTRREREVAVLIAQGLTNRQIADELIIARFTANTHVRNIRRKLGFRSRAQIASWVGAHRLTLTASTLSRQRLTIA